MSIKDVDIALLGAYVDGELDPEERAWVSELMVRDPEVARQVTLLSGLKSSVNLSLSGKHAYLRKKTPSRWPVMALLAACLCALLLVPAVMFWKDLLPGGEEGPASLMEQAHASWGFEAPGGLALSVAGGDDIPKYLRAAYVPDLSAAKLKIVHAEILDLDQQPYLVVGYRGSRGCKLTLLVGKTSDKARLEPVFGAGQDLLNARWQSGHYAYTLIAKDMDKSRFDLLVQSISQGSFRNRLFPKEVRMALKASRERSQPCGLA